MKRHTAHGVVRVDVFGGPGVCGIPGTSGILNGAGPPVKYAIALMFVCGGLSFGAVYFFPESIRQRADRRPGCQDRDTAKTSLKLCALADPARCHCRSNSP